MTNSIIWLRRVLRLDDNKVIKTALEKSNKVLFCFVFDSKILKYFPNKDDRRLSFIVEHLALINEELEKYGSSLTILYGDPAEEIPKLAQENQTTSVYVDDDFEPHSIVRDNKIESKLKEQGASFVRVLDHLVIHPKEILKSDHTPYKVFTPFMKAYREKLNDVDLAPIIYDFSARLIATTKINFNKEEILKKAGYNYKIDDLWHPEKVALSLSNFLDHKIGDYHLSRNMLSIKGSSKLSPYLRFGALSVRRLFREALELESHPSYVNELIWREFYAYIMYHFPCSVESEFQQKYIGKINWEYSEPAYQAFCLARTGFPVVDAAVSELLQTGWMHNRARMIVASFFTKNLFMDWRLGEKFFAQYLMDYDLASNVGGWQWTASTGTDAQPYFRVFNPIKQSETFDPDAIYIKYYLPILTRVDNKDIHDGEIIKSKYKISDYPAPIVDYKSTRAKAIEAFRSVD